VAKENREEILAQSNDMTPVAGTDHTHLPDVVRGSGGWAGEQGVGSVPGSERCHFPDSAHPGQEGRMKDNH